MPRPRAETDVIVDFAFEDGLLFVEVRNLGTVPALKVSCTFDKQFRGLGGARVDERAATTEGIASMATGKVARRTAVGDVAELLDSPEIAAPDH